MTQAIEINKGIAAIRLFAGASFLAIAGTCGLIVSSFIHSL